MYRYCKENIDLGHYWDLKDSEMSVKCSWQEGVGLCRAVEKFQGRSRVCMRVTLARSIKTNQSK